MKMRSKLVVLCLVVSLIVCLSLAGTVFAADKVYKWKVTAPDSSGVPRYEVLNYFVNTVEKMSGGRLQIELYPAGSLYPVFDSLDSVKMGVTQATITWGDYWVGKEPMLQLLTYRPCDPFKGLGELNYLLMKYEPLVAETYKDLGVTYAGSLLAATETFQSNVKINSLDDFKGLRVRTSGLGQQLLQKFGASIVTMPMPEVYSAMQLGTLDAFESGGYATNLKYGYQEVTKYNVDPAIHCPSGIIGGQLLVNNRAWDQLPDDLKSIIKYAADASRLNSWTKFKQMNQEAKVKFKEAGNEFITLPKDVLEQSRKIGVDVLLSYENKSPRAKQFVKIYQETLQDLGYNDLAEMFNE